MFKYVFWFLLFFNGGFLIGGGGGATAPLAPLAPLAPPASYGHELEDLLLSYIQEFSDISLTGAIVHVRDNSLILLLNKCSTGRTWIHDWSLGDCSAVGVSSIISAVCFSCRLWRPLVPVPRFSYWGFVNDILQQGAISVQARLPSHWLVRAGLPGRWNVERRRTSLWRWEVTRNMHTAIWSEITIGCALTDVSTRLQTKSNWYTAMNYSRCLNMNSFARPSGHWIPTLTLDL